MSLGNTPRPVPIIFDELTFSRKKKSLLKRENHLTPRSPIKSAPPVSRIFRNRKPSTPGALAVSFRQSQISGDVNIKSPLYKNFSQLYFEQCFTKLGKLGCGSFGEVVKVQSKEDGKLYAIKKSRECFRSDFDRKQRLQEVNKNEKIAGHPNCVSFHKAWEEENYLYIQTELCEMSLKDYAESVQVVEEKEIWNIIVDLCAGLKHIHSSDLAHMDIKPANLFLGRDGLYKIGDFGLVVELTRDLSDAMDGDSKYLAPELMEGKFTKAADIFSLGITLLELSCSLELPLNGPLWHQLRQNQLPLEFIQGLSDDLIVLITSMMQADSDQRPTVEQIMNMPSVVQARNKRKNISLHTKMFNFFMLFVALVYNFFKTLFCLKKKVVLRQRSISPPPLTKYMTSSLQQPLLQHKGHESIVQNNIFNDSLSHQSDESVLGNSPMYRNNFISKFSKPNRETSPLFRKSSPLFNKSSPLFKKSSPLFQPISNKKETTMWKASSPMWNSSPLTQQKMKDFNNTLYMNSPHNSDCSPPAAPVSDKIIRSRLFTCSSDEDESFSSQRISKNLIRSFNESNEE